MITSKFDISGILAKSKRINKITQADMRGFVRRQMTLTISSSGKVPGVIQITAPFGKRKGSEAFKAGKLGIDTDLSGVFQGVKLKGRRTITQAFGRPMETPVTVRTTETHPDVQSIYDRRKARQSATGRRRLSRGQRAAYYVSKSKLEALRRKLHARVGWACACWYQAGLKAGLSVKGIPAWVKRHTGAPGSAAIRQTNTNFSISVTNQAPYGAALNLADKARIALGYRMEAMQRELPRFIAAILKKARAA